MWGLPVMRMLSVGPEDAGSFRLPVVREEQSRLVLRGP